MSEKIYVGNGKEKTFDNGGSIINVTLDVDDLAKAFKEYGWTTPGQKRKIKVNVSKGRELDQYGNTHYVVVDTWKPTATPETHSNTADVTKQDSVTNDTFQDDVPF